MKENIDCDFCGEEIVSDLIKDEDYFYHRSCYEQMIYLASEPPTGKAYNTVEEMFDDVEPEKKEEE